MKLCIFNGSPRAEKSNTAKILNYFAEGFLKENKNKLEYVYIKENNIKYCIKKAGEAENIFLAFPLYVESMPANVKLFLEHLPRNSKNKKNVTVFIQSGFPESSQMGIMKEYFKLLFLDMDYDYNGMILKGYGKSVEMMPEGFNKKWLEQIYKIGFLYGHNRELDMKLIAKLGNPERLQWLDLIFYKFLKISGVLDIYTSIMLKKNGKTKSESYAKPLCSREE